MQDLSKLEENLKITREMTIQDQEFMIQMMKLRSINHHPIKLKAEAKDQ